MYDADEFSNDLKGTAASTANAIKTGYQIIEFLQNKDPEQIAALAVNDPSFLSALWCAAPDQSESSRFVLHG